MTIKLYLWDVPVSEAMKEARDVNSYGEYGSEVVVVMAVSIVQARRRVNLLENVPDWAKAWCQTHDVTDTGEFGVHTSYRE